MAPASDACPDANVYDRLGRLERRADVTRMRDDQQDKKVSALEHDVDGLCTSVTRLNTTIKVATAIMGFLLALAGIVIPLVKG